MCACLQRTDSLSAVSASCVWPSRAWAAPIVSSATWNRPLSSPMAVLTTGWLAVPQPSGFRVYRVRFSTFTSGHAPRHSSGWLLTSAPFCDEVRSHTSTLGCTCVALDILFILSSVTQTSRVEPRSRQTRLAPCSIPGVCEWLLLPRGVWKTSTDRLPCQTIRLPSLSNYLEGKHSLEPRQGMSAGS